MKKLTNYLYYIAMVGIALWVAYTKGWILTDFEMLKPKQAIQMIKNDNNITLLDVRTKEEYQSGHIPNSVNIPLKSLQNSLHKIPTKR